MIRKATKISLVTVLLLAGVFWTLTTLILPGVIRDQAKIFGEQIGYKIDIGEVDLSPILLQLRLNNLSISSESGESLFKLKQVEVDARFLPLLVGRLSLEQIKLDAPEILLARGADTGKGSVALWNWQRFVDDVNLWSNAEPPKKQDTHSALKFSIDQFVVENARLAVRDGQQKASYDLGPFSVHLTDLTNQDDAGHMGGSSLSSKYVLNLGRVKIPLPKLEGVPDRQIAFDKVTATGHLIENSASALRVALDLALDEGTIKLALEMAGEGKNQGAFTGKLSINSLAVKPLLSLAPSYQALDSPSGVINGELTLTQDADALTVDGDVNVDKLDIRVLGSKDPLLAWENTVVSRLHLSLPRAAGKTGLLTINDVLVSNPKIRFVMDAQRQSNFRALFSKPDSAPAAAENPVGDKSASLPEPVVVKAAVPAAPGFRYDVRSVRLKNGAMHFADESIKPVFRVDVTDLNGSVQGISNEPNRYASLVLNGRAAKTGSLRARGQLAFADPRQNNDVSLIFRNIPLNATNPYTMTFAGYAIDDGRIDVDLRYVTKAGQLQGKNRFVIKKIKLGEAVPDYQGTHLPLGLAIALLEDSDGMIDVNIPVKGNVNEPEFSVGHLVWQAVKTLLSNVVTAPFRALGALLGIENIDAIAFVPGESALPVEGEEDLRKIADYLAKRPKSKLVIHGTYDPLVDSAELARAMADQAILEASGIKVVAGEPLPLPNLSDPKVKAGLNTAYAAQVGRIKLGQRLLTLPDNADRDTQLRQELIQSYKISDDQLKALAARRAAAVKARLMSADAKLADRISIGEPETISTDEAGVPIKVELETAS